LGVLSLTLAFGINSAHSYSMTELDPTDYSVVVKRRAKPPKSWRWEIYCAGKTSAIAKSWINFPTVTAANRAGKKALKKLFLENLYHA